MGFMSIGPSNEKIGYHRRTRNPNTIYEKPYLLSMSAPNSLGNWIATYRLELVLREHVDIELRDYPKQRDDGTAQRTTEEQNNQQ
jgi:hypothetical protein